MKKTLSRIFAVLLVVSLVFTQLLVPVNAAEVKQCTCSAPVKGTEVSANEATCDSYGYKTYTCKTCKGLYVVYTEEPTGLHDIVNHEAKDPTCTEIGWAAYETCANCKYTTYVEIPALGHDLVLIPEVPATCTATGVSAYYDCSRCDYIEGREELPMIPHETDIRVKSEVSAGCETSATEEREEFCTVCGEVIKVETVIVGEPHGHNYVLIDSKPQICANSNGVEIYACEYCRDRKEVIIPMLEEHDYVLTGTTATCTKAGQDIYTCQTCGYVTVKDVKATGHKYVNVPAKAATCTETGYNAHKYCANCGDTTRVDTPINPLNHVNDKITIERIEPTCTEVGYTEEIICEDCNKTLKTVAEIPATGHDVVKYGAKDPTCTQKGWEAYERCKKCSYTTYVEIPALGHNPEPTVGHKPATCEVEGYDYQMCLTCQQELKSNIVPALGHDWSEWTMVDETTHTRKCQFDRCEVDGGKVEVAEHNIVEHEAKEPTCTEIGWDAYVTCSDCEYTTYVEKAALGHRNERWVAQEATCTQDGWSDHIKCARCGEATPHTFTPALGHRIMNVPDKAPSCFEAGWTKHTECARCGETSPYFVIAPYGEHGEVVIDEAVQPTFDETGLTEGSHCGRCNEVLVQQIVIDRVKEDVSFTYEATGLNGSEYTVNSGYVTLNVYMNVNSTAARLWGADLTLKFDSNLTLTAVDGCAFEYANNSDVLNNSIKLAQGMNVGSNFKTFEMGQYLFATLTFKVDKDFHSADAIFEIVADECNLVRRDIENNTDFSNELVVDFGIGTEIYVAQLGDANADGKFNSIDTMSLAQWFANADIDAYEAVYDMNKDGYIDGDDFAILRGAVVRDYSYLED